MTQERSGLSFRVGGFLGETRVFKARGAPSSDEPWVGSDALLPAPGPGNRDPRLMRSRVTQPAGSPGWPPRLWRLGTKLSAHLGPRSRQASLPLCCGLLPAPVSACVQEGGSSRCPGAEALPGSSEAPSVPWGPLGCLHSHSLAAPGSLGPGASGTHSELSWAEGMGPIAREHSLAARGSQPVWGRVSSVQASGDPCLSDGPHRTPS